MKTILVTTDFSRTAMHAANYAASLAEELHLNLTLVHANDLTIYTDGISPMEGNVKLAAQKIAEEQLEKEVKRIAPMLKQGNVTAEFFVGDIVAGLQERCLAGDVALTVMGTTGQNSSGLFWGSRSMNALRNHYGPILIVPPDVEYKPISKILLCMDLNKPGAHFPYEDVKHWVNMMGAHLDILHVQPLDPLPVEDDNLVKQAFGSMDYSFHTMESENLRDAITYYLSNNPTDWIIVIPKKYNFFESLFHKSKSEIISKASNVPVLALHEHK